MTFNCQSNHFLKRTWAKIENDNTPKTEIGQKKGAQEKPNLHTLPTKTYSLPEKQNAASKHVRASKHIYKNASFLAKSPEET
jgi:hypothetical protein